MASILSEYSATIAALSLLLAGRAAGLEPAAKCQAKKAKLAAVYTACRINAAAKALKTGHPPDPFICDAQLAQRWQRVETKSAGACPTINDLAAMQNSLNLLSAAVVSSLKIEPRFCGDGPYPQCDGLCFPGQECRPGLVGNVFQIHACFCQPVPRRAFLTSTIYPAALGGLSGADTKCQMHAEEAGFTGTYKAWLSDSQDSPATRFLHSSSPYVRVDGIIIAVDWFDLTDGSLLAPISVDETGYEHSAQDPSETDFAVWTNTAANGSLETSIPALPISCSDWTSAQADAFVFVGAYLNSSAIWTRGPVRRACAETHRLYCFQQ